VKLRLLLGILTAAMLLALTVANIDPVAADQTPHNNAAPSASPSTPAAPPKPVTAPHLPAPVPPRGTGVFQMDQSLGPILGVAGRLRRFHVAVETDVAGELAEFTRFVDQTLGDPRSWIGGHQHRFQRVPGAMAADFTIYLATRQTAFQLCRAGGVDIRIRGVPYTSCRRTAGVIINLDRWRLSVPGYVDTGVPLTAYRAYVINHEVGHELGHGHMGCPRAGTPAPVMLTQTLGLRGCTANPWPYPGT
jgi:hypothetical protein